jgi:hypothetical protein
MIFLKKSKERLGPGQPHVLLLIIATHAGNICAPLGPGQPRTTNLVQFSTSRHQSFTIRN